MALFNKIGSESRKLGAEFLEGPFNPNHYSELGILINNFDAPPAFFETYNPSYYPLLLSGTGFSELIRFHARINENIHSLLSKIPQGKSGIPVDKNITVRKFNILRMRSELDLMRDINNDAFEGNWYFLPLSREEC